MILTDITQVQALLPNYQGGRYSVRYNTDKEIIEYNQEGEPITENTNSPSGWRADVIEQERVVTPAEYDEKGNIITEAVTETVYDVRVPEWVESKIPESIQKYKIKIILTESGEWQKVVNAVEGASDRIKIAFNEAKEWRRDSKAIEMIRQLLGKSNQEVDEIFIQASKIQI